MRLKLGLQSSESLPEAGGSASNSLRWLLTEGLSFFFLPHEPLYRAGHDMANWREGRGWQLRPWCETRTQAAAWRRAAGRMERGGGPVETAPDTGGDSLEPDGQGAAREK